MSPPRRSPRRLRGDSNLPRSPLPRAAGSRPPPRGRPDDQHRAHPGDRDPVRLRPADRRGRPLPGPPPAPGGWSAAAGSGRPAGLLVPPAWGARSGDPWLQRTECLLEPHPEAVLLAELRFLHTQRCTVQRTGPGGDYQDTPGCGSPTGC
ncbi:hypothetical protein GXW82_05155 [Streptacidiphilus sp. 4-A2]|nr:hypothetical protein [Streptacidiphilus sp. 4-A2]